MNPEEIDIFTAISGWIERNRSFTRDTQATYRRVISDFVKKLPDEIESIGQLQNDFIEDYIESITDRYTPRTIKRYRECLRTFYHFISEQYGIDDVVVLYVRPKPKPRKLPELKKLSIHKKLLYKARKTILTSEAVESWFTHIQGLSPETKRYYKNAILALTTVDISNKPITKITSAQIKQYLTKFSQTHKNSTVNNHLMAIKSWFSFMAETYGIPNITKNLKKLKEDMTNTPFINCEQYLKVLKSATPRESDTIKMLANGGFRCSELCSLTWDCFSPQLTTVRFQGKGRRTRTIPVNETMREVISKYSRNEPFMSQPRNRKTIYNACKRAGKRVGVHLAPHMLRRFFATQLLNKGVSLLIISRLLGHSNIQTTETYLKIDASFLNGATNCLDVLAENN